MKAPCATNSRQPLMRWVPIPTVVVDVVPLSLTNRPAVVVGVPVASASVPPLTNTSPVVVLLPTTVKSFERYKLVVVENQIIGNNQVGRRSSKLNRQVVREIQTGRGRRAVNFDIVCNVKVTTSHT